MLVQASRQIAQVASLGYLRSTQSIQRNILLQVISRFLLSVQNIYVFVKTWNEDPDVFNKHIQVNGEKQVIKKPEEQRIAASMTILVVSTFKPPWEFS